MPIAPGAPLLLAVAGAIMGLVRREPLVLLGALVALLIPWASALTLQGLARHTFAAAPFLALLATLPYDWLVERGIAYRRRARGIRLLIRPWIVVDYFRTFPQPDQKDWGFPVEHVDTINVAPGATATRGRRLADWPASHSLECGQG